MNVRSSCVALLGWAAGVTLCACGGGVRDEADETASAGAGAGPVSTSGAGPASSSGAGATTGAGGVSAAGGAGGAVEGGGPVTGGEGVACADTVCGAGEQCLVCTPTDAAGPAECVAEFTGTCAQVGQYPPLRMTCDGHEDCAAAERCSLLEGSLGTYAQCADYCEQNCTSCFAQIVCHTLDDCPTCATSCAPYHPDYVVSVCQW